MNARTGGYLNAEDEKKVEDWFAAVRADRLNIEYEREQIAGERINWDRERRTLNERLSSLEALLGASEQREEMQRVELAEKDRVIITFSAGIDQIKQAAETLEGEVHGVVASRAPRIPNPPRPSFYRNGGDRPVKRGFIDKLDDRFQETLSVLAKKYGVKDRASEAGEAAVAESLGLKAIPAAEDHKPHAENIVQRVVDDNANDRPNPPIGDVPEHPRSIDPGNRP